MKLENIKDTLLMPKTEFPMRANLNEKDEFYFNLWNEKKIYEKLLEKNKNNKVFILHDGPPYANGNLHVGHALNKILKDIIVRYKTMNGFYSPFIPGWDTHGLPIENKIKNENIDKKEDPNIFLEKAKKYALEQVEIQKSQFKKFGLLSNLEKKYVTLESKYISKQLTLFKELALKGLIYRGLKPVFWSPSSRSALAEAEVEYMDHRSPSIFVAFKVKKGNSKISIGDNIVIWTTTPWTLIANAGVAVGDIKYIKVNVKQENYIIAKELLESVSKSLEWTDYKIECTLDKNDLIGLIYESPLNHNLCPIVEGHHVTTEAGSGLVHIAPLFGEDDFIIGKKHNLNFIMHIEDDGKINYSEKTKEDVPANKFNGIFYEEANKNIGIFLQEKKYLLSLKFIKHSYPHDWRTHKPVIFRGTPQWFVSIDKVREKILNELNKVKFHNDWGKKRLSLMIQNRSDWTISRQRMWGVPIIIFYDENKKPIIEEEIFEYVIKLIEKKDKNIWFTSKADDLLPEKYRGKGWTKEKDIMDVWFDSGSSFFAANIENNKAPFDLYLEGSDQYRGWFNSSLINSVAFNNEAPYKEIVSHGFVLDEKGTKMSKSKGNVVDPLKIVDEFGSDILRMWVANSEYSSDILIGKEILNQNIEIYRKIRNTLRHMLGNLFDYEHKYIKKDSIHLLVEERINNLKVDIKKSYENYNFVSLIKDINNFITDLSSYYLSITKDILYIEKNNNVKRRQVQHNLYLIVELILVALAPIIPTTTEEAYSFFNKKEKKESIHLEQFFEVENEKKNIEEEKWKEFFKIKDEIYKLIEEKIKISEIKRSNEAHVFFPIKNKFIKELNLKELLMIGKITNSENKKVVFFESLKCTRCWNHFEEKEIKNDFCLRCLEIVKEFD